MLGDALLVGYSTVLPQNMIRIQPSSLFVRHHSFSLHQKARPSACRQAASLISRTIRSDVKSFDQIPGPGIFENISTFIRKGGVKNLYEIHCEQFEKFGPIFKARMLGKNLVHIADAESNAEIFRNERTFAVREFIEVGTAKNRQIYSLLANDYERWQEARSPIAPTILRPVEVQKFAPGINDVAKDAVIRLRRELKDERIANLKYELDGFTAENILLLVFGIRAGFYDDPPNPKILKFIRTTYEFSDVFVRLGMGPRLWRYVRTPAYRKLKRAEDNLYSLANEFVELRKTKRQQQREVNEGICLYTLMTADQSRAGNEDTSGLAITLSFTGVETTSTTMMWCLYHLARNPEAQEKAYQEVVSVDNEPSEASRFHSRLPYLKACIKESSRLMPIVSPLTRTLSKDTVLHDYNVPAKSVVCMWVRYVANSAKNFTKPEQFDPQRWIRGKQQEKVHPYAHLPFGFGVRMCLGHRFADLELTIGLAHILQNFRLEYIGEGSIGSVFASGLSFPDRELPIKFIARM